MISLFLNVSLGIISAGYLPQLPPLIYVAIVSPLLILLSAFTAKYFSPLKFFAAFMAGMTYGICAGHLYLAEQLDQQLVGQDIFVEGKVVDLPEEDSRRQLFSLKVRKAYGNEDGTDVFNNFPNLIHLSSYGSLRVKTGEQWRFRVKLKRPRGFVNPDGYDYQVSLLRQGIGATGYIKASAAQQLLVAQPFFSLDLLRYQLQQWLLQKCQGPEQGVMLALLVGDTSKVDRQHWGEMVKTGTNHLMAISGLHLGFFAIVGFFYWQHFGPLAATVVSQVSCHVSGVYSGHRFYPVLQRSRGIKYSHAAHADYAGGSAMGITLAKKFSRPRYLTTRAGFGVAV